MKGYMYILLCSDDSYYTGSTTNLELRLAQHQAGEGANHTKKRLPVTLLYYEELQRIDEAFNREKQVQRWSRKKKEALINNMADELKKLAECMNETHSKIMIKKVAPLNRKWFRLRSTTGILELRNDVK